MILATSNALIQDLLNLHHMYRRLGYHILVIGFGKPSVWDQRILHNTHLSTLGQKLCQSPDFVISTYMSVALF